LIDQNAIAVMIQQQIADIVREQVSSLLSDPVWIEQIEKRSVDMLAAKIESRMGRLNDDPELSSAVQNGIRSLFEHGFVPDITRYVGSTKFQESVDRGINKAVSDVIATLSLDPLWLARVETMVNHQMHTKINKHVSELQIDNAISGAVNGALDRWLEANPVARTLGINDQAQQMELTVIDGAVIVERELHAAQMSIVNDADVQGQLTVKDLDITGSIKITEPAWNQIGARAAQLALDELTEGWRQGLVTEITEMIKTQGIDIDQVTVAGQPLLTDGRLGPGIIHSNLRSLGLLEKLDVGGTVTVRAETIPVVIGSKKGQAWIGSQEQPLVMGTAQHDQITLGLDGTTTIHQLQIGNIRIGFAAQVPGHRGNRGDIMFNSEPAPGAPVGWQCLGAFNWQSIKVPS